jgi:hypothetical protein
MTPVVDPVVIGNVVTIRTILFNYIGRIVHLNDVYLILDEACWQREDEEVAKATSPIAIFYGSIIDLTKYNRKEV